MESEINIAASSATTPRRNTLLRLPAALEAYGVKRPTLYDHMQRGLWPRPIKLGPKLAVWPLDECDSVINARIAGKSVEEIRDLVVNLVSARELRA